MAQHEVSKELEYMVQLNDTWRGTDRRLRLNETKFLQLEAENCTVTNYYY